MLVSNTINPTIIPALSKAVERFVLIYKLNDVTEMIGNQLPSVKYVATQNGRITAGFGVGVGESEVFSEQGYGQIKKQPGTKGGGQEEKTKPARKIDIGEADKKSLMLEPTYMLVNLNFNGEETTKLLGIKVLPLMAKSDENLIDYITYDRYVKGLRHYILKLGRNMTKKLMKYWTNVQRLLSIIPGIDKPRAKQPTGDPRADILLRDTAYSIADRDNSNIFVVINKADLGDDFMKTKAIRKLFKLGWDNMIFVDDVNKVVSFCFKTFRGMCSQIPYQMMYASFGREQREAYESVEDVRRASSSIFKRKTNFQNVFEDLNLHKEEKMYEIYLENKVIYQEMEFLAEDFAKYLRGLNFKKVIPMMKSAYEKGNAKKLLNVASKVRLPELDMMKVKQKMRQRFPEYNKSYDFAKKVLENSIPDAANSKVIDLAAMSVALVAVRDKSMGVMKATTNAVKYIVRKFRKTKAQSDRLKIPKAYATDVALGWAAFGTIFTTGAAVTGLALASPAKLDILAPGAKLIDVLKGGASATDPSIYAGVAMSAAFITGAILVSLILLRTLNDLMKARKEADVDED